jgi:hypothetical protein
MLLGAEMTLTIDDLRNLMNVNFWAQSIHNDGAVQSNPRPRRDGLPSEGDSIGWSLSPSLVSDFHHFDVFTLGFVGLR